MTQFTPTNLPEESACIPALAIASIPLQKWQDPYDLCTALREGTIFPDLNKPFFMGGREYGR